MKRLKKLPAVCAATGFSFCLALGLNAAGTQTEADQQAAQNGSPALQQEQDEQVFGARQEMRAEREMEIYEVSELHGLRVESRDGEQLGSVDSLAIDLQTQSPSFVVVESGGILGIGGELKVVPFEAVKVIKTEGIIGDRQVLRVDIDEAQWEQIPSHEAEQIAQLCEGAQAREIYQRYNIEWDEQRMMQFGGREEMGLETKTETHQEQEQQQQEFGAPDRGLQEEEETLPQQEEDPFQPGQEPQQQEQEFGAPDRGLQEDDDALLQREEQTQEQTGIEERQEESVYGARGQRETTTQQRGIIDQQRTQRELGATDSCKLVLTREVEGLAIHDAQQQEVGSVKDLVVDMRSGQVKYVLISPQTGFFERTEEVYAVSPGTFRSITTEEVVLEITREQLEQAEQLTQTTIREHSREDTALREQTQVYRYERDQIEFGSPDRGVLDQEEEDTTRQQELETDDQRTTPPPHAQDRDRRGPPPHAGEPGPPPHARGPQQDREFGQPDARDAEQPQARDSQQQDREFGQPGERRGLEQEDQQDEERADPEVDDQEEEEETDRVQRPRRR